MENKEMPLVSVIIPTYKRKDKLKRLLKSIFDSEYPNDRLEVIVIVDADGLDYRDFREEFPKVRFIFNKSEKLLAECRNIGIKNSRGDYLFVIDDDNVVDKKCIPELVTFLRNNPKVGIVGPLMYYYTDPQRIWCAGIKRNYYTSLTKFIGRNETDNGQFREPIRSEDFPNAFMVKKEVVNKVGYFDSKNFPIHYDEADFCKRTWLAGYEVYTIPNAKIWHDIPLPRETAEKGRYFHVHNELRAYYAGRNRILFHRKYSKLYQLLIFLLIFNPIITIYYLGIILLGLNKPISKRISILKRYIIGVIDGITGR